jgi:ribulose 1,5-bisphosphate synthetase/thiazole synthase
MKKMAKDVMILVGAGQIGLACTRRLGYGMKIVMGDRSLRNAGEGCSIPQGT